MSMDVNTSFRQVTAGSPPTPVEDTAGTPPVVGVHGAQHESPEQYSARKQAEARQTMLAGGEFAQAGFGEVEHFRSGSGELTIAGGSSDSYGYSMANRVSTQTNFPLTPTASALIPFVNDHFLEAEKQHAIRSAGKQLALLLGVHSESGLSKDKRPGNLSNDSFVETPAEGGFARPREQELHAFSMLSFQNGFEAKIANAIASGHSRSELVKLARENLMPPGSGSWEGERIIVETAVPATLARHLLKIGDKLEAELLLTVADLVAKVDDASDYQMFARQYESAGSFDQLG